MPLYTVKVAVKYERVIPVQADSREAAEDEALEYARADMPTHARGFEGCPYVIETREPKEAK